MAVALGLRCAHPCYEGCSTSDAGAHLEAGAGGTAAQAELPVRVPFRVVTVQQMAVEGRSDRMAWCVVSGGNAQLLVEIVVGKECVVAEYLLYQIAFLCSLELSYFLWK